MTIRELIKHYRLYTKSQHYHPQTDLASFIAYLEEEELLK